jgi:hypothetical protein
MMKAVKDMTVNKSSIEPVKIELELIRVVGSELGLEGLLLKSGEFGEI